MTLVCIQVVLLMLFPVVSCDVINNERVEQFLLDLHQRVSTLEQDVLELQKSKQSAEQEVQQLTMELQGLQESKKSSEQEVQQLKLTLELQECNHREYKNNVSQEIQEQDNYRQNATQYIRLLEEYKEDATEKIQELEEYGQNTTLQISELKEYKQNATLEIQELEEYRQNATLQISELEECKQKGTESERNILCPDDFHYDHSTNMCFQLNMNRKTRVEAQRQCQHQGPKTHLITLDTVEKVDVVRRHLRHLRPYFPDTWSLKGGWDRQIWLGAIQTQGEGDWFWTTTGQTLSEEVNTMWMPGEPNNYGGKEDCLSIVPSETAQTAFSDSTCWANSELSYLCERQMTEPLVNSSNQQLQELQCPDDFVRDAKTNMCFQLNMDEKTMSEAQLYCQQLGPQTDMITLDTVEKVEVIRRHLASVTMIKKKSQIWIGGVQVKGEGSWFWTTTGQPLSEEINSVWYPGQPDNYGGREQCLAFFLDKLWTFNDLHCEASKRFICERQMA